MFINMSHNICEVKCLINLEIKENFVSQFFIKDAQLLEDISSLL